MAPTIMFLKNQDFIGVDYAPGDTARVPHDVPKKMAAYWIKLGIAKFVTEEEMRTSAAKVEAAKVDQRRKAAAASDSAAFAETIEAPEDRTPRRGARRR